MSLTAIRKNVRAQLWTLLEAEPEVTSRVRTGNRAKLETVAGWLRQTMDFSSPDWRPRISLCNGRWTSSAFQEAQSFAEENIDFLDGEAGAITWPLKLGVEFIIKLEVDNFRPDQEDDFEEAVHVALLKGGPRLGNADVMAWTISAQRSSRDPLPSKKIPPLFSTLRLNAVLMVDGRTFITTS